MASATQTRDHGEIRRWVEDRGGIPTIVDGTGGLLRVDFVEGPKSGGRNPRLQEVDWDEWFRIFDENDLVFLFQPGGDSKFFKLISAATATKSRQRRGRRASSRKPLARKTARARSRSSGRRGVRTARRGAARTATQRKRGKSSPRRRGGGAVSRRKVRKGGRTVTMECREV